MENRDDNLVSVYEADDESTAELLRGLLESAGIPVMVNPNEPMLEAPLSEEPGIWGGDILVPEEYADKAREIIAAYEPKLNHNSLSFKISE